MKRLAFFGWCVATFCVCILMVIPIGRFTFAHYFDTPEWFKASIRWIAYRSFASETYHRESMDIEDACDLVLIIIDLMLAAVIVVPASIFAWRRFVRSPQHY
ncbi:exported hypothetical protein [Paraburkholderia piptadeniae]|uniref:Transmembrane protein n=1 Tax=Paraburkholderia piptadeniae TaxID=1701573 RepID=A0A1N7RXQ7_9BURK|nr:hypothetical protein [Paraburkholderia piptadeniae]SIT39839.1 exported hypothetical protein [Paraburkholderia piptadeniae]